MEVADTGPGISADALPHIFEPFFTTKGVTGGTGLGLTISREIIRSHRGEIRVESHPGHTTRFIVSLPLARACAAPSAGGAEALPALGGKHVMGSTEHHTPTLAIIMIAAFGTIETAVEAMRLGAFSYLTTPFQSADLLLLVARAFEEKSLRTEIQRLQRDVEGPDHCERRMAKRPAMPHVLALVERLKDHPINVLCTGERGTGTDLIARPLYYHSSRIQAPFVPVNCAAFPEPLVESEWCGYRRGACTEARTDKPGRLVVAHHGTLFLDEGGEFPLPLQAKLLRVLDDKAVRPLGATRSETVKVRVMAATNRGLRRAVRAGQCHPELFYRLTVVDIHLPPLRDRPKNLPLLIQHVLARAAHASQAQRLSEEALRLLLHSPWPRNVRELDNTLERALVLCQGEAITPVDLPAHLTGSQPQVAGSQAALMRRCSLADLLQIDRKTLYRQLVEYSTEG